MTRRWRARMRPVTYPMPLGSARLALRVSVLPIISIAVLLVALGASLVLSLRSGELRAGILAGVIALLLAHPALQLWQGPVRAPAFDLATGADAAFLLASLLCLFV